MKTKQTARFLVAIIAFFIIALILATVATAIDGNISTWTEKQEQAHEIAETARAMGLPEDDPIIVRAKEIWEAEQLQFILDRDIIATVIYNEAWAGCTDRHRELVAAVIVNRVKSDKFPNTVYDVVTQKGQYMLGYANGDPQYTPPEEALETCREIAARALRGDIDCPDNVLYQAEFKQGSGVYEVCKTSYSTTYFCYG
ncbi:MAG: cell wall hydrolase [Clostridiales bacterium]|nr:cell wall hydrolase [Clostridiales bacterium]